MINFIKSIFGLNGPTKKMKAKANSFTFTGPPGGEVEFLEKELSNFLLKDKNFKEGYLSKIKYESEDITRIVLCIKTVSRAEDVIKILSQNCGELISSIDIMFFEHLKTYHIKALKEVCKPFCIKESELEDQEEFENS